MVVKKENYMRIKKKAKKHVIVHPLNRINCFLGYCSIVGLVLVIFGVATLFIHDFFKFSLFLIVLGVIVCLCVRLMGLCIDVIWYYLEEKGIKIYVFEKQTMETKSEKKVLIDDIEESNR
jgi:hypothetical protein